MLTCLAIALRPRPMAVGALSRDECLPGANTRTACGLHGDNYLASGLAILKVPDRGCDFAQQVRSVDGWRDVPRLENIPEDRQVRSVLLRTKDAQLLAYQGGERNCPELAIEFSQPPPIGLAANDDKSSAAA